MEVSAPLRRMVHLGAPTHELRECFRKQGGLSLREEGVLLALEGKTSLEEVLRVTHNDEADEAAAAAKAVTAPTLAATTEKIDDGRDGTRRAAA
jgi:hypothetical protein